MNKKLFLTSIFAIAFACPAFAVDGNATIENGDTCNIDNLGTSENNSTANIEAIWTLQSINCPAGTSFNASTASCDTCSAGSWCVAGTYDVENNATGDGATSCSTLSGGYNSSLAGATSNTDCYKGCVAFDVAHAETVSGNVYYDPNDANGNKQCSATACAAGWHIQEGFDIRNYADTNPTTSVDGCGAALYNNGTFFVNGASECNKNQEYYGLTNNNEWSNDLGYATIHGISVCSTQEGYLDTIQNVQNYTHANNPTIITNLTDERGQEGATNCYCKMTGVRETDSSVWQSLSSSFVFVQGGYSSRQCSTDCSMNCAVNMGSVYINIRHYLFPTITNYNPVGLATCEANNIALQWYNDTVANEGTKITPNNDAANQCTYNETITVPTNEMQKPGYTFGGWKLRTNN